ncbi:MAG: ribonuclease H family protein [Acidimicrobiales bacterium]
MITVYTDGSCLGNPGPGGWAWAVPEQRFESGADPHTTNQRMEITAPLRALQSLGQSSGADGILVRSDSTYVVNCFVQRWWAAWQRKGWRNAQGKPVANRDLWEPLLALALDPAMLVRFEWVKGHSGDRWNDVVDELANAAASAGSGRAGTF